MTTRAAIYLRVSTNGQTTESQRRDLERHCEGRGWKVTRVYEDAGISGAKDHRDRPGLASLLRDARRRRFDVAAFWSVDRLGRSTAQVTRNMEQLDQCGVRQFFAKEGVDGTTAHGQAMLEMAAVFAKLERRIIQERVRAGLEAARAEQAAGKVRLHKNGRVKKPIGRPRTERDVEAKIVELRGEGMGKRRIAKRLGVGVSTVYRVLGEA